MIRELSMAFQSGLAQAHRSGSTISTFHLMFNYPNHFNSSFATAAAQQYLGNLPLEPHAQFSQTSQPSSRPYIKNLLRPSTLKLMHNWFGCLSTTLTTPKQFGCYYTRHYGKLLLPCFYPSNVPQRSLRSSLGSAASLCLITSLASAQIKHTSSPTYRNSSKLLHYKVTNHHWGFSAYSLSYSPRFLGYFRTPEVQGITMKEVPVCSLNPH